jgi:hypothetical protein
VTDGTLTGTVRSKDKDAVGDDAMDLLLTGPEGAGTRRVDIHVTPLTVNTAPSCEPMSDGRRSDGLAPVEFELYPLCWDAEHDGMRLEGGGPGEHLDSPMTVAGGHGSVSMPVWRYRTAATDGAESATYWATDDLAARSEEAAISVVVGPGVDRLPACWPTHLVGGGPPFAIHARPGATRNFGIFCQDADSDAFTTRLGTPPQHGSFSAFVAEPLRPGLHGNEQFIDVTYVPATSSMEQDPFTVVAENAPGRSSETPMAIVPSALPDNFPGGCAWWMGSTYRDVPTVVTGDCDDPDGDPVQASIVTPPAHGTAGPPAVVSTRLGGQRVEIRYVPAPGFTGLDAMRLSVGDGNGGPMEFTVSIRVDPGQPPHSAPLQWPLPPGPGGGPPAVDQPTAVAPREQARNALGARDVVLVRRAGDARVYARRTAVRRGIRAVPGRPVLAVTCDLPCRLDTRSSLVARAATNLGRQRATAGPGRAGVLTLSRHAARRLRAAAAGRVAFALLIRADGRPSHRATVRLRVRR